jgi:UDP-glucose 4-epimerase
VRVMVTGGAGFIGSNIVRRRLELGHEPVVLDNISSGYRENLVSGVAFFEGDVRERESIEAAMDGCGVAPHLAASVGNARSIAEPQTASMVNVIGTLNVLEAARVRGINRVVFFSSAGIFGELKTLPIVEDHPQDPDSPYGTSKLAAEKMCLVYNKLCGMHNVCLRCFNVFGPTQDRTSQYSGVVPQFMRLALEGGDPVVFGGGLPQFAPPRLGDVKHSFADITAASGCSATSRGSISTRASR